MLGIRMRSLSTALLLTLGACSPPESDPATAAFDTAGCAMSAGPAYEDAEALVREFVRRDFAGEFVDSLRWFNTAVTCPGHEPGPDEVIVVRDYKLSVLARSSDTLRAEVVWDRVGYGGALALGTDVDTVTVVRTPQGWRVASPALKPHQVVSPPRRSP